MANVSFRTNESPERLLKELVLSPLIYIRFLGILCSIIVFGCISDKLDVTVNGRDVCLYNRSNACNFGVTIGVIGFLMCLAFLVKDVLYVVMDFSNNLTLKKGMIVADAVANGLWAFMWFVAFVYIADQWRKTDGKSSLPNSTWNCGNSGVVFSLFSIFIWAAIVVINVHYFARTMSLDGGGAGIARGGGGGYASFPEDEGGTSDDTSGQGQSKAGQYQPPQY